MESDHFHLSSQLSDSSTSPNNFWREREPSPIPHVIDYGLLFLYNFHSFQYPKNPLYSSDSVINEKDLFGVGDRQFPPVEQFLIDPQEKIRHKETYFAKHFRGFAIALKTVPEDILLGDNPYECVVTACSLAYGYYDLEVDLRDINRQPLNVRDILPKEVVINEMWNDFVVRKTNSSQALRTFIKTASETTQ